MCGIFAVATKAENAGELTLNGLKKLEYRGYDSWGVATLAKNGQIFVTKKVGKIGDATCEFEPSQISIGHTRWATHGGVTETNAHPHKVGRVTIVHNGILENHEDLKKELEKKYQFISQTDTEVFAALIDSFLDKTKDIKLAIAIALQKAVGRYAIVVMIGTRIFASRKGSPLVVGKSKNANYFASDIPAILEHTKNIMHIKDGIIIEATSDSIDFFEFNPKKTNLTKKIIPVTKINQIAETGNKDGWPHFMLKEIHEIPMILERSARLPERNFLKFRKELLSAKRLVFTGSGTAHKMSMLCEYFFRKIRDKDSRSAIPEEASAILEKNGRDAILCAISQSGETADVLETIEIAEKSGAKILGITNSQFSSIARNSKMHIDIFAGTEHAVASTKAACAQLAIFLRLAGNAKTLKDISSAAKFTRTFLKGSSGRIEKISEYISKYESVYIIGRDAFYPLALETAIKIQEVSYIHAQGFLASELKHGPLALITHGTPVIVLGSDPHTLSNAREAEARGAHIIGFGNENAKVFSEFIEISDCGFATPIAMLVPLQLLSYRLAILKGLNPDKPRNLAKSVTVK